MPYKMSYNPPKSHYDSRELNVARIASLEPFVGKYVRCVSGSHTSYTGLATKMVVSKQDWFSNQNGNNPEYLEVAQGKGGYLAVYLSEEVVETTKEDHEGNDAANFDY